MQLSFNQHEFTRLKEPLLPKISIGIMVYSYNQTDVVVTVPHLENVFVYQLHVSQGHITQVNFKVYLSLKLII